MFEELAAAPLEMQNAKKTARQIARALTRMSLIRPIVMILHPESAALAANLARKLKAPLDFLGTWDVFLAQDSSAILASVTEDGTTHLAHQTMSLLGISPTDLQFKIAHAAHRASEWVSRVRSGRPLEDFTQKTVLLVTGPNLSPESVGAAAQLFRKRGVHSLVVVAAQLPVQTAEAMRKYADTLLCLRTVPSMRTAAFSERVTEEEESAVTRTLAKEQARAIEIDISDGVVHLPGYLHAPAGTRGLVIFVRVPQPSGAPDDTAQYCTKVLNEHGWATLDFAVLTKSEAESDINTRDVPFLASRLMLATRTMRQWLHPMPTAYFGIGMGASTALWAGTQLGDQIQSIAILADQLALSSEALALVTASTLLITPAKTPEVIEKNRTYLKSLRHGELVLIQGASSNFTEPGVTEQIAVQARLWFEQILTIYPGKIEQERRAA